jgi:hypothetical protein
LFSHEHRRARDMPIRVLGFWWWWLFVVPSLRSRRPKGPEKKALDIAFLGTPLISLIAPAVTKDTGIIWGGMYCNFDSERSCVAPRILTFFLLWIANLAVVATCYAFAFATDSGEDDSDSESKQPEWLKFIYKSLDFGTGRERGARK